MSSHCSAFFCPRFCVVLDIVGSSSSHFCHICTGFTVFRWDGRWLSASDMDVLCSDVFILCKKAGILLRSHKVFVLTVIAVYKLKTPI